LRRGTRAAANNVYFEDEIVCGIYISEWIALTEECYGVGAYGHNFFGYPNGLPLIKQEQCVVDIMKIILMELIKGLNDGQK
jgi:hypothetical protein